MRALQLRRLLTLAALVLLTPQIAIAGDPPGEIEEGVNQDPAIYGGTAAQPCGWPTAVYLSFGFSACSGTLVHPDIVITAAHCPSSTTGRPGNVSFGEGQGGGIREVDAMCYSNPSWTGAVGDQDYGYCLLEESVTDIPIIPPAYGCDTSVLSPGREVVIVGFGNSDNGGSGSKREVTTTIQAIGTQAVIGGNGEDACQGDSGGPVYIKLKSEIGGDDTWRAFGITSGGGECGQGGIFSLMHIAIPWIESHSGIDITPCHDSEGNWAPTPDCGAIPLDPGSTNGASWANGCSGGPVSGFSALCGEAFGSGEDPDAPTVAIVDPATGQTYDLADGDSQAAVTVTAESDDGEGFGVADVRLVINGQEFEGNADSSVPYSWNLVFAPGGYIIEAIATDYVGNQSAPDVIAIGVDQAAPDLPESGDGDGDPTDSGGDPDGGADEGPGETGGDPGFDGEKGCACSAAEGERSGAVLGLLGLFGLFGLRRASTSRSRR